MDNIVEPNETFDFSTISLAHPVGIQGGAYFTKIETNKKPLYIQTSKSLSRQGIVKNGKKYYCDLMFDKNSETLINWFENLEEKCKKMIYEKKDAWFEGNLEENDIENAFSPLIRVFKSGKFYLLRTNIKNSRDDTAAVKIYNENQNTLEISDITNETEIISILEIQGIKFTSRNFQIEIDLKQVMVLDNEPIFESCLIKNNNKKKVQEKPLDEQEKPLDEQKIILDEQEKPLDEIQPLKNLNGSDYISENKEDNNIESIEEEIKTNIESKSQYIQSDMNNLEEIVPINLLDLEDKKEQDELIIDFEELTDNIKENTDILQEIGNDDLYLENIDDKDGIKLKKPNQVYFELYKEARNKAKQAKKNAILAYLEAKNIKKTYLIENINDSDSDFDAEIDDVSESELEGL